MYSLTTARPETPQQRHRLVIDVAMMAFSLVMGLYLFCPEIVGAK
jgi:hypothetical protein